MSASALADHASVPGVVPTVVRVPGDRLAGTRVREAALVLAGTAILVLAGRVTIPLPFTPVPVSLATLAVLLEGPVLGPRRASASTGLYLVLGLIGIPVFAGGASGWAFSSFGYIIGYLVAALVVGALAERGAGRSVGRMAGVAVLGSAIIYAVGLAWLVPWLGIGVREGLALGVVPFLIGDVVKIVLTAGLVPAVWTSTVRR